MATENYWKDLIYCSTAIPLYCLTANKVTSFVVDLCCGQFRGITGRKWKTGSGIKSNKAIFKKLFSSNFLTVFTGYQEKTSWKMWRKKHQSKQHTVSNWTYGALCNHQLVCHLLNSPAAWNCGTEISPLFCEGYSRIAQAEGERKLSIKNFFFYWLFLRMLLKILPGQKKFIWNPPKQ